jgi:hypothetical protein
VRPDGAGRHAARGDRPRATRQREDPASDEFKAKLAQQGMAPVANTAAELRRAIREESVRWAKVIKERGLAAN